jgi:hypothetical protein
VIVHGLLLLEATQGIATITGQEVQMTLLLPKDRAGRLLDLRGFIALMLFIQICMQADAL